jgi:myo-inositol-hexaphosphate 3-phosphohydrolase
MDGATRIWLDDPNPIFRMGLAAALRDPRFLVVGESAGFVPPPALDNVDVLVFDLGDERDIGISLSGRLPALGRRQRRSTRLVGLVPGGDPDLSQASQCTILVRSDLTPEGFRDCLVAVAAESSVPSTPVAATSAAGGRRLRRLVKGKGALFLVVAVLAAGAFGPTSRAEGLSGAKVTVTAVAETTPVQSDGDAAGDVAIWVNAADPSASLVLGTDRKGALESYDLAGRRVQRMARPAGTTTTIDIRTGFPLGGKTVALVATGGRMMSFFRLDPGGRQLVDVTANDSPTSGPDAGLCLYRSPVSERFYAFLTEPRGDVTQYELFDQGGFVDARAVRTWPISRPARSCVTDDETGRLFLSEGDSGIWRYNAEPDASPVERQQVDKTRGEHLAATVGGLAVVEQPGRRGYLLASSPGDSTFAIYERGHNHAWVGQREVVDGSDVDGCSGTTGIDAVATGLGPRFPAGLFVCQDGRNTAPGPAGRQNFKYVRLERLLDAASLPA